MSTLTRAKAEKVLAAVEKVCAAWIDPSILGSGPTLVMDWEPYWGGEPRPTILWEEGPYEWTYALAGIINNGESSREEEFGFTLAGQPVPGVFAEPGTGWALCLYQG